MENIEEIQTNLLSAIRASSSPRELLKSPKLRELYDSIKTLPPEQRADFGCRVNDLKQTLESKISERELQLEDVAVEQLDITAPWDKNTGPVRLFNVENASEHPLTKELAVIVDIFTRMGFEAVESRQIDDDKHMFAMLNFPENHPARDNFDTFKTEEGFIPPAHTSTMQHRILKSGKAKLEAGGQIAAISYGRCFRNEDIDATHEHTFHQVEGVFVSDDATLGQMIGTLKSFFEAYYEQPLRVKTQPAYFPFVEPGLEFAIEKPAVIGGKPGEWLEMVGCGMIHPNVLKFAGIDPIKYRGFAWGGGVERLAMLKYGIDDLRYFESGKLQFLRRFK